MSNPNPLIPQGPLLEEQARSRSTFQMAAFIVALHVVVLGGFLFLGCKKEDNTPPPMVDTFSAPPPVLTAPTNFTAVTDPYAAPTNTAPPPVVNLSPAPVFTPAPSTPAVVDTTILTPSFTPPPTSLGSEHVVKKGDIAYELARKNGVSLKQLQEANPGRDLAKLRVGDRLQIPAPSAPAPAAVGAATDGVTYTVKGGDNLSRLARKYGTTVKAIRDANGMTSNDIKVGQKLKIPSKSAESSEPTSAPTPATIPAPPVVFPANPITPQ